MGEPQIRPIFEFGEIHIMQLHELYQHEWWTQGRTLEETRRCVEGSQISIGLIDEENRLVGFVRVLTDYTFKALIFDVIIAHSYRGQGLGDRLLRLVKELEDLDHVKHFELYCLPDLFDFYHRHGFSEDVGEIHLMRYTNT